MLRPTTPRGDEEQQVTSLEFQIVASLGHGQSLWLVGDIEALGADDLENGVALLTTPELYPTWFIPHHIEAPRDQKITYRYAIYSGACFQKWEGGDKTHTIMTRGSKMIIQDHLYENDELNESPEAESEAQGEEGVSLKPAEERMSSPPPTTSRGRKQSTIQVFDMGGDAGGDMPVVWHCDQSGDKKEEDKEGVEVNSLIGAIPNRSNKRDLIKRKSGGLDVTPSYYSKKLLGEGGRAGASLGEADGVIIVGHKLPVFLSRDANGVFSCKWNYDNYLGSRMNPQDMDGMKLRVQWIGTISIRNETGPNAPVPEECEEEVEQLLRQFNCSPIFIPQDLYDPFYEGFCFGTLWPVFHNIADVYGEHPTRWWNANEQGTAWQAYTTVNRLFANKVVEVYDKGDLVWVNDLHLLLVPSFLSRRLRSANIGLFLHTPFPSSEIFRTLSVREDLLRGILSADHIGFHLFEYARHFLACCRRILNITWQSEDGGIIGLNYGGRTVAITVSHVGIEPVLVDHALQQIAVKQKIEEYRQKYKGKFVIGGIDRLERLKGVPLKLLAFEKFLEANPALRDKVVFRQIGCTYGCHRWKLNSKLKGRTVQEAKMLCKRINEKYGEVVDYVEWHTNVALEDRVAVWAVSNVILLSSIREGVNLYPYEYVHTRGNKPGVMILSEFSSCSRVLNGALRINPWRIKDMVEALEHAYKMGETERESRMKRHRKYVAEHTTIAWAERVLMDMKRAKKQNEADYVAYGLGMGFRLMHMDHHFTPLNEDKMCEDYKASFRRLILLDFGGTLVAEEISDNYKKYHQTYFRDHPSPDVLNSLVTLCRDTQNTVFILSGKEQDWMEEAFASVPGLGLVAEHGFYVCWPSTRVVPDQQGKFAWETTGEMFDESWKDLTNSIMTTYHERTNGTYIEVKGSSLVWHYRDADPEFGALQSKELQDSLSGVLKHFPVEVLNGKDYLEVRPAGVNKGVMVERIYKRMHKEFKGNKMKASQKAVDFVLCIGDDDSDEKMFKVLNGIEEGLTGDKQLRSYPVTVGKKPSEAKNYLNDVDDVLDILRGLTKLTIKANRNLSMNDLSTLSSANRSSSKQDLSALSVDTECSDGVGGLAGMGGAMKSSKLGMRGSASTPHLDSMGSSFGDKGRSFFPDQWSENPQGSGGGLSTFDEEEDEDFYDDFDAAEEGGLVW